MNPTGIKKKKQPRSKSVMAFGYVHELVSDEIPDPVAYYTDFVAEKNKERAAAFTEETRPRAFVAPVEYNLGQFLLYTLLEELNIREVIDILAAQMRFQFRIYDMIAQLIFFQDHLSMLKIQNGFFRFPSSLQQLSNLGRSGLRWIILYWWIL